MFGEALEAVNFDEARDGFCSGGGEDEFFFARRDEYFFVFSYVRAKEGAVKADDFSALAEDEGEWACEIGCKVVFFGECFVVGANDRAVFKGEGEIY